MKSNLELIQIIVLTVLFTAASLPAAVLPQEIEDPECLGVNKEPYHATLMPYGNLREALAAQRDASSFCQSLNGFWKFNWVPVPDQRPVDFYKPDFDVSGWNEIPVPSNWQILGYGTPYYRNLGYTFQKDWPHVLSEPPKDYTAYKERNPVGSYRREFQVPESWSERRIFITFDGVDSAFFLWINGQKIGYSVNSRNAAEFDITRYVRPGKNVIAVEVYCYCAGSYLEDQDMWRLSGIFRNVTLWSAPNVHIRDFDIKTDMDSQYKDATLTVSAKVRNFGDISVGLNNLSMTLYDNMGNLVSSEISTGIPALEPGREQLVTLSMHVKAPDKWTAETPNLYTTVLVLSGSENKEIISARTGFRKIEIKGRLFTINGVPVKLKGVNRHENWPDTGHYVSEERMIHDLRMLKQGNCNHVRTCHYSDDPRWYELCDQWGIYLNAEANVECHGYYDVLDREPKYEKAIIDRNLANVENFKNHASVIMWSLGNENGGGRNFVSALKAVKSLDTTRPVHYEPFGVDKNNPADVDSRMYSSVEEVEKFANSASQTKPFYLCEYAHAMLNSMGALAEYNELFDKYPPLMGGAIWEWHDQGLWNTRNPERMYLAFGGGFGDRPNDHYYIHKGVVFADRSPKPHYPEMKRLYQWIGIEPVDLASGRIKICNKYAFTGLENFNGQWTISEDGIMIHSGKFEPFDLAPGCEKILVASFPQIAPRPGAEYFLQIEFTLKKDQLWARSGYVVAQAQFKLPFETRAAAANIEKIKPLELQKDDKKITIKNNEFTVIFSKTEGTISQLVSNNINILAVDGGPGIHLWRAPHQNDDLWAYEEWRKYGLDKMKFSTIYVTASMPQPYVVRIEARIRAQGENNFSVIHSAVYTIYGDGTIVVDNSIAPSGPRIPLARMGVRFLLNSKLDQFTYLGRGPMENYADRKQGSDIGLYSSSILEQMTPYAKPMECGNHEDVRWAAVTGKNMPALMVQANGNYFQVSALPYTDEVMTPVEYAIDLPPSINTVLVLASQTLGVGSRSCGPRPLEQYIVWPDPVVFSYILRILPIGENDLLTVGRTAVPDEYVNKYTDPG